jgi:hypothetical protein
MGMTALLTGPVSLVEVTLPPSEFRYLCRSRCVETSVALSVGRDRAGAAAILIVRISREGRSED